LTARVLVVEDDPPIASVLERGLTLAGYDVEVVLDGPAGLSRWAHGGWHVVVLDVMLPGMDGVAMCTARRAAGDRTPVLLLTARDDERLRSAARAAGADAFLTKPYAYADLLATLARLTGPGPDGRQPGSSEGTGELGQAAGARESDR
jgi:DNA-binding response OmpR family regulator